MLSVATVATSAVYGAVDIATEYADQAMSLTKPFQNVTDIQRTAAAVGGALVAWKGNGQSAAMAGTVATASIPLFEKTVVNAVLSFMGKTTRFVPRGTARGQILVRRPGSSPGAPGNLPGVVY